MSEDFKQAGWQWIKDFYARPPVRSACLVLQDRHSADVTFLLYLCWLDRNGLKPADHYLSVNSEVAGLRRKIKTTRALRRFLSTFGFADNAAQAMLERELSQEHDMFQRLCDFKTISTRGKPVLAKQYIAYKGAIPTAAGRMILKQLKT